MTDVDMAERGGNRDGRYTVSPGGWVGLAVGILAILAGLWRGGKGVYQFASMLERLVDDVADLKSEFQNGIRTDIRQAKTSADEAVRLAGETARHVSLIDQREDEHHTEVTRAINALRGEVDIYTNVVLTDRQRIRARLRDAGLDLPDDDGSDGGNG